MDKREMAAFEEFIAREEDRGVTVGDVHAGDSCKHGVSLLRHCADCEDESRDHHLGAEGTGWE